MAEHLHIDQRRYEQLEKRIFNTGPRANKTLPTTTVIGPGTFVRQDSSDSLSSSANAGVAMMQNPTTNCATVAADTTTMSNQSRPSDLASLAAQLQAPPPGINESSNLSSAGSISDREPETPDKQPMAYGVASIVPKSPILPSAPCKPLTGESKRRKRKRADTTDGASTPSERTPKAERKITEYIRASPKRHAAASAALNGDAASAHVALESNSHAPLPGAGQFAPVSPQPPSSSTTTASSSGQQQPPPPQRTTPTHLVTYASSDSNQSPPTKAENSAQVEKSEDLRAELTKKERLIDDMQK
uniref:Uncharacterized protein n=1 Tax=Plectus sambesii TaxID=2011161 RepID=A0A914UVW6_9BILA